MYNLDIVKDLKNMIKPLKEWIFDNADNPLFWLIIVLIVLGIFGAAYTAIHGRE